MLCHICNEEKLSKEFVYENLSELCEHPGLFCMECALAAVNGKCPYKDCDIAIPADSDQLEEYKYILDSLYPDIVGVEYLEVPAVSDDKSLHEWIISVTLLTGERIVLSVLPSTAVLKLKELIHQKNGTPVEKQKLIFKEKELEAYRQDGSILTLQHYGIQNNSTICMLVMLYTIPQHFSNVVFDLHWGYPYGSAFRRKRDYLDASCLVFRGTAHIETIDYTHTGGYFSGIRHSGDVMDERNKIGHHTINVNLQSIPSNVTHLFFTLSAWSSPTIQHFPNPSLKFFEASNKNKDLCSTSFNHACHSQAVIMCSVSRKSGFWQIFGSGKLSRGNAQKYQPIIQTIQQLIASGV